MARFADDEISNATMISIRVTDVLISSARLLHCMQQYINIIHPVQHPRATDCLVTSMSMCMTLSTSHLDSEPDKINLTVRNIINLAS